MNITCFCNNMRCISLTFPLLIPFPCNSFDLPKHPKSNLLEYFLTFKILINLCTSIMHLVLGGLIKANLINFLPLSHGQKSITLNFLQLNFGLVLYFLLTIFNNSIFNWWNLNHLDIVYNPSTSCSVYQQRHCRHT